MSEWVAIFFSFAEWLWPVVLVFWAGKIAITTIDRAFDAFLESIINLFKA